MSDIILTEKDLNLFLGSQELLPCPFCGDDAWSSGEAIEGKAGKAIRWTIQCMGTKPGHSLVPDCFASVIAVDPDQDKARIKAIERWNRRRLKKTRGVMRERPILFSAPMVAELLMGNKGQTRRILKLPNGFDLNEFEFDRIQNGYPDGASRAVFRDRNRDPVGLRCPYGCQGDRLWVKETWNTGNQWSHIKPSDLFAARHSIVYAADFMCERYNQMKPWRSPLFMVRWMSRITLAITGLRVERLNKISAIDARAEGCRDWLAAVTGKEKPIFTRTYDARKHDLPTPDEIVLANYRGLWESINGPGSWNANPWVWVVEFPKLKGDK